jgi:hypothetical protein
MLTFYAFTGQLYSFQTGVARRIHFWFSKRPSKTLGGLSFWKSCKAGDTLCSGAGRDPYLWDRIATDRRLPAIGPRS